MRALEPRRVGPLLRQHRQRRRLSQLTLSLEAGVSTRHLSFVETHRAQPSRELVLQLAEVLQLRLRERNELLLAAGYAPVFPETPLDAAPMAELRRAVELLLRRNEPFGALALDRRWDVVMVNGAYAWLLGQLTGAALTPYAVLEAPRPNVLREFFDPRGLRPFVKNWDEVAGALVPRLLRERAEADEDHAALIDEVLAYPGVPRRPAASGAPRLVVPLQLAVGGQVLSFFSTLATVGTPRDVTVEELRIESFHPVDEATSAAVAAIGG